jgi:hypothetical protein
VHLTFDRTQAARPSSHNRIGYPLTGAAVVPPPGGAEALRAGQGYPWGVVVSSFRLDGGIHEPKRDCRWSGVPFVGRSVRKAARPADSTARRKALKVKVTELLE